MKKISRFLTHMTLMLCFMFAADHWMRASFDRAYSWVPPAVNAGGALFYLIVVWISRKPIQWIRSGEVRRLGQSGEQNR